MDRFIVSAAMARRTCGRAAAPHGGARAPRRRVEQGRRDHGQIRGRGRRRARCHVHRWGAGECAQPQARPPGDLGEHRGHPPRGDGAGPGDPRRAAGLARLRGLRFSRGRPDAAGDPDRYPEAGEPWQPLKLYYQMGWSRAKFVALHEAMLAAGVESPYGEWLEKWEDTGDKGHRITTRVPCGEYFEQRDDALRAHATQVDPDGFWFRVPLAIQR